MPEVVEEPLASRFFRFFDFFDLSLQCLPCRFFSILRPKIVGPAHIIWCCCPFVQWSSGKIPHTQKFYGDFCWLCWHCLLGWHVGMRGSMTQPRILPLRYPFYPDWPNFSKIAENSPENRTLHIDVCDLGRNANVMMADSWWFWVGQKVINRAKKRSGFTQNTNKHSPY